MARTPNGASSIYLGNDGYWHGRVTVGVKDDGRQDRRHVMGTHADVTRKVRALERQRDSGAVRKAGASWTVEKWLRHWVENIAAPFVRDNTIAGYRVAVNVHLIPALGKHRLDRLEPEHLEKLYVRMMRNGSAPATAHQAQRTTAPRLMKPCVVAISSGIPLRLRRHLGSVTRRSSRTRSTRSGCCSRPRSVVGTALGGPSRSRSGCGRGSARAQVV